LDSIFLTQGCPVVPAPFVVSTLFPPLYCLYFFVKIWVDNTYVSIFLGYLFCSIDLFVYSFTNTTVLIILTLLYVLTLSSTSHPTLFFSFNVILTIWIFSLSVWAWESICSYPQNNVLGFWLRVSWICNRWSWKTLILSPLYSFWLGTC
jgi:hypothetical protein